MPPMGELTDGFPSGFDGNGKLENPLCDGFDCFKVGKFHGVDGTSMIFPSKLSKPPYFIIFHHI